MCKAMQCSLASSGDPVGVDAWWIKSGASSPMTTGIISLVVAAGSYRLGQGHSLPVIVVLCGMFTSSRAFPVEEFDPTWQSSRKDQAEMNLSVGVFDELMSVWVDHLIDYIKTKVNNGNRSHQDILASVNEGTFKV